MNFSRRSLLIAAPAVILTPHILMPVKPWIVKPFKMGIGYPMFFDGKMYEYVGQWREGGGAGQWKEVT